MLDINAGYDIIFESFLTELQFITDLKVIEPDSSTLSHFNYHSGLAFTVTDHIMLLYASLCPCKASFVQCLHVYVYLTCFVP